MVKFNKRAIEKTKGMLNAVDFNIIYNHVKMDKNLYKEFSNKGMQLLENNGSPYSSNPEIGVKTNLICYNNCSFCPNPHTGEYLDLNKLLPYCANNQEIVLSGGGEALLHPSDNLMNFLDDCLKINDNLKGITLFTAGCSDKAPQEMKSRYYSNLERFYNLDINKVICFSYSGKQSNLRLKEFCDYMGYLDAFSNNSKIPLSIMVSFIINYDKNHSKEEIFSEFTSNINYFYDEFLEYNYLISADEIKQTKMLYKTSFPASNILLFAPKGEIMPCCSIVSDFKPLPKIADAGEPLEIVNDKRLIYYGFLQFFKEQTINKQGMRLGDYCNFCAEHFPKYLAEVAESVNKKSK